MIKEIIINSSTTQTRVAITEDGNLVDFFVDYPENRRMVGDIYLGKVARVLPGIKAAFIDIGMKHDAFLHFSDIGESTQRFSDMLGDDSDVDDDDDDEKEGKDSPASTAEQPAIVQNRPKRDEQKEPVIPKLYKGQDIIVQITKEPVNNKGVRVSSSVSLAGRFCVLLPFDGKIGVSKKIYDFKERRRLRSIARSILPRNYGLIIRTVAKNQTEDSLKEDLKNLVKTWEDIETTVKSEKPPALIFQDLNTTSSVIRDLFTPDVSKVFIDSKKLHKQIKSYVQLVHPELADKIEHFRSNNIFDSFKIEEQIKTLMGRKVPLPSGGYLIIEHTEAMVVIDVNSGRYAKSKEQELNSLKTDLEASREITRQMRLRDIGGIIVIDFIDLEEDKNRKKIYDELRKEFRKDRAKVSVLPMSDFGLVQITRQRVRQNILQAMKEVCPYCMGTGLLTKHSHVVYDLEDWLKKFKKRSNERSIIIKCHPAVAAKLKEGSVKSMIKLQLKYFIRLRLIEDETMPVGQIKFFSAKTEKELTDEAK